MTSAELNWFHKKLLEVKDAELKAREEAMNAVSSRSSRRIGNKISRRPTRLSRR